MNLYHICIFIIFVNIFVFIAIPTYGLNVKLKNKSFIGKLQERQREIKKHQWSPSTREALTQEEL